MLPSEEVLAEKLPANRAVLIDVFFSIALIFFPFFVILDHDNAIAVPMFRKTLSREGDQDLFCW